MKTLSRILIIDDVHLSLIEKLNSLGIHVEYMPNISPSEVENIVEDFDGIVVRSKMKFTKEFLQKNKHIQLIARAGSGLDNIDTETADGLGISCINAPEGNCDAVGEQTIATLLTLATKLVKGHNEIKSGLWDREGNRGFEIKNKTIGIIGYGHTGSAVARKICGFGCSIIAYDRYKSGFENSNVKEVTLKELLNQADIISFHVPLTDLTRQWINDEFINSVVKPFVLLNLSRGAIMNASAVIRGIESGKITAFGSDVLENENLSSLTDSQQKELDTMLKMNNVVLTPHVGGWTEESYKRISEVLGNKIETWCKSDNKPKNRTTNSRQFVG